jgi:hypothetical protein
MNDYFASWLAHERQADYVREVEHDELAAQVHLVDRPRRGPVLDRFTDGSAGRFLIMAVAAIALVLALAAPVAATGPGCSDFGAASAGLAQEGGFGKLVSSVKDGVVLPGFNNVGQLIQAEHGRTGTIFTWPCAKYAP